MNMWTTAYNRRAHHEDFHDIDFVKMDKRVGSMYL